MASFIVNDPSIESRGVKKSTVRSWFIVIIAAFFFFYEFIQMNMFNSIAPALMNAFHVDAAKLGIMSSFYFIANVVFLFIAGMLLDRCATRRVILTALAICIIGTASLSFATSFSVACFCRFLTGIGSAFCFLSVIRLATRWFPPKKMALVTGVVVTMAMLGGFVSQAPMTLLAQAFHWRNALQIDAATGIFFFILIAVIVKDYPEDQAETHLAEQAMIQQIGYLQSMKMAFFRLENWFGGLYVCFMNLPVGLLGGLWGVLYLIRTQGVSHIHASEISSMLFFGTMIGGPIAGFISDKMQMRRPPMFFGALISLCLICVVIFVPHLSYGALFTLFLLIGIFTSTQIIGYPLVAENSKRIITAMSVSVVNISVQGGNALFQPFFGYLLDKHMFMRVHQISDNFATSDFTWAMWIFPVGFVLAMVLVFCIRETRCKQLEE